jgi:hypothetical protein
MTRGAQIIKLRALLLMIPLNPNYWMLNKTLDSALHKVSRS